MILKSMSVECNKTDMDNYAGDVDEEESGKFTFVQFCSVRTHNRGLVIIFFRNRETRTLLKTQFWVISKGHLNVPGKDTKLSKLE